MTPIAAEPKRCSSTKSLAGGLTAENVGDAIRQVRPFGLDLCSSVRTNGQLDPAKLATFMMAVRRAEWALEPA
jgi:phosphoribosylanthranilate isomerase